MNIHSFTSRWNAFMRKTFVMPRMRKRLKNKNFSLITNNCTGGFIYHDLGLRFNSPTINLFFYKDHFFTFLEHLEEYLDSELKICNNPQHTPEIEYPVFNLGDGERLPLIELHFLHYHDVAEAKAIWEKRSARVNLKNLFVVFAFCDDTDEAWLARFDAIPIKNKLALVNRPFPQYKSACYIPGYEDTGIGGSGDYVGLRGCRKYDAFDFVNWFNTAGLN